MYLLGCFQTGYWVARTYKIRRESRTPLGQARARVYSYISFKEVKEDKWVKRGEKVRNFIPNTFKATATGFDHARSAVKDFGRGLRKQESQ